MSSAASLGQSPPATFSSSEAEAAYWRERAEELERTAKEAREELEEFQEGSRELEAELEMQLEQAEARLKEQRSLANRLQMENQQIKGKLDQVQRDYNCQASPSLKSKMICAVVGWTCLLSLSLCFCLAFVQVTELQAELTDIKSIREQLNKYVRDLEQQNDDLERAKRSVKNFLY